MLRLFPRSWFGDDALSGLRSKAVEALQAHWRTWLVASLARIVPSAVLDEQSAIAALQTLDVRHYLALDRALRYAGVGSGDPVTKPLPVWLTSVGGERPEIDAYLFVACAHVDGFVREQALVAFHQYPGRLAMAAALIRCDDWVSEVRQTAAALLLDLTQQPSGGEIFSFLELLLMLRRRGRFGEGVWRDRIEPELLSPQRREERWAATASETAEARAFALHLVVRVDRDRAEAALARAVADDHAGIALWALDQAATVLPDASTRELLRLARQHRRAPVRAQAIRLEARLYPAEAQALLRAALFDPASGPRNAAAYLLQAQFQESPLSFWREAIDAGPSKRSETALAALGEHAESSDAARLSPFLQAATPRLRAYALRGLVRAKSADAMTHLIDALSDPSARIVSQAIRLIDRMGEPLHRSWLDLAYARASSTRVRIILIAATRHLGKWETLDALLCWTPQADDEVFAAIAREVKRWLDAQIRRFTPLAPALRPGLLDRLMAAEATRPDAKWRAVDQVLRASG